LTPCTSSALTHVVWAQVALGNVQDSALASELFTKLSLETAEERALLRKGEGWSYTQWNEYVCTLFRLWYARWRYLRRIIAVSAGARDAPVVARPASSGSNQAKKASSASNDSASDSGSDDGAADASHVEVDLPEPTAEQQAEELEWSILLSAFGKRNPLRSGASVGDLSLRARALLLHTLVQWHLDDTHDELSACLAGTEAADLRVEVLHSTGTSTDYMLLQQLPGPVRLYSCALTRSAAAAQRHSGGALSPKRRAHAATDASAATQEITIDESDSSGSDSADDEFDVGNAAWGRAPSRPAADGFALCACGDADILQFCRSLSSKAKGVAAAIEHALSAPAEGSDSDSRSEEGSVPAAAGDSADQQAAQEEDMHRQQSHVYVSLFEEERAAHEAAQEAERSRRVSARLAAQVAQAEAERAAQWQVHVDTRREELSEHFEKHHSTRQRLLLQALDAAVWGPQRRRMFPGHAPPAPSSLLPDGRRGPSAWSIKAANAATAEAEAVARREAAEEARRQDTARLAAKRGSRSRRRDVMRLMSQLVTSANYECGVWQQLWARQSPAALAAAPTHAASAMQQEVGVLEDEREAPLRAAAAALSRRIALQRHSSTTQDWPGMRGQWAALEQHFKAAAAWEAAVNRLQRRLRSTRDKIKGAAPTALLNKWLDSSLVACRAALTAQGTPCPEVAAPPPPASGIVGVALLPTFLAGPILESRKEEVHDTANKQLFGAVAGAADDAAHTVVESWIDPDATHEQCALFHTLGIDHAAAEERTDDAVATRARRLSKAALLLAEAGAKPSDVLHDRQQLQDIAEHLSELMRPVRVRITGGHQYAAAGRGAHHHSPHVAALGDAPLPKVASYPRLVKAVDEVVDSANKFLQSNLGHIRAHVVPAAPWPVPRMPLVPAGANVAAAVHAARMQAMQMAQMQAMTAQTQDGAGAPLAAGRHQEVQVQAAVPAPPGQVHFLQADRTTLAPGSSSMCGAGSVVLRMHSGSASVIALPEEAAVPELRGAPHHSSHSTAASADGTASDGGADELQLAHKVAGAAAGQASHVSVAGAVAGDGSVLSGGGAHGRHSFGEARSGFGNVVRNSTSPDVLHAPQSTAGSSRTSASGGRGPRSRSHTASRAAASASSEQEASPSYSLPHQNNQNNHSPIVMAHVPPTVKLPPSSVTQAKAATVATTAYQASVQSAHVSESSDDEKASKRVPAAHASAGVSVNGSATSDQDEEDSFAGGQSTRSADGDARRRRHLPAVTGMAPSALGLPSKAPAVDEPQQANALDVAQPPQDIALPAPNVAPPRPAAPFAPGARHSSTPPTSAVPMSQLMVTATGDGDSVVAQGEPALSVGQPRWAEPRVAAAGRTAMPRSAAGSDGANSTSKDSPGRQDEPATAGMQLAHRNLPSRSVPDRGAASSAGAFEHGTFLPEASEQSARGGGMSSFSFSQAPVAQYTMSRGGLSAGGASVGTPGRAASSSDGSPSDGGSV